MTLGLRHIVALAVSTIGATCAVNDHDWIAGVAFAASFPWIIAAASAQARASRLQRKVSRHRRKQ